MALKLYLIAGIIVEAFIIKGYAENEVPYKKAEIFFGGIIDIVTWPLVLLVHIIINGVANAAAPYFVLNEKRPLEAVSSLILFGGGH